MSSDPINNINNDFEKLNEAAREYAEYQKAIQKNKQELLEKAHKAKGNPDEQMLYLMMLLCGNGSSASVLAGYEDTIGGMGAALKAMGAMTALANDVQKIMTGDSAFKNGDDIKQASAMLDRLLDGLGMSKDPSKANPDWIAALGDGGNMINGDLLALRQSMYVDGSTSEYQLTKGSADYQSKVYFDATNPFDAKNNPNGKLIGFGDMKDKMSQKDQPGRAADAAKNITNNFQTITATEQSLNAASNTAMNAETNQYNQIQSAVTGYFKSELDGEKVAIQNGLTR